MSTSGRGVSMHSPELFDIFRLEAEEHLDRISVLLPELTRPPSDAERIAELRRRLHCIKGAAAVVGQSLVAEIAHSMEDVFDDLSCGNRVASADLTGVLVRANDAIAAIVHAEVCGDAAVALSHEVIGRIGACAALPAEPMPALDPAPGSAPASSAGEPDAASELLEPTAESLMGAAAASVRVSVGRIEALTRMVADLSINRSSLLDTVAAIHEATRELSDAGRRLSRTLSTCRSSLPRELDQPLGEVCDDLDAARSRLGGLNDGLETHLRQQRRLHGRIEHELMRIRMVPLGSLGGRLHRAVRGVAAELGKEVELTLEGEEVEVDKVVIDQLIDPLLHLVRNAVDHGIEPTEIRRLLGKSTVGSIILSASFNGTQVILRLRDDGSGIDPEAIRATAVRTGRLSAATAAKLSAAELHDLLFSPGFSTARAVTHISGRGVGLDIVRDSVVRAKGNVVVESEPGRGTEFTIALPPTTMSTSPAVLVKVQGETFALLLASVLQILRYDRSDLEQAQGIGFIRWAGSTCPLVWLGDALSLKQPANPSRNRFSVVILRVDWGRIALVVEELIGQREVMVMSFGSHLGHVVGVAGATILPDGRVVLILNPRELVKRAAVGERPLRAPDHGGSEPPTILVVDDSLSVRRSISSWVRSAGWRCVTARDGLEALDRIAESGSAPDAIVVDDDMPRLGGLQMMGVLQGQAAYRKLPVLIHAARVDPFMRRWAFAQGAAAFLAKPCKPSLLIAELRRVLEASPRRQRS